MNPNGQPYTPPYGNTPQGLAVANAQPNSSNTQAPAGTGDMIGQLGSGQELSPQQVSSLTGAYGNAANQAGNMQTSDARQAYVNNSNIPAMQSNYDQLARQLFEYDQGTLSPQFQGTNPGIPSDAASFGRVDASPLAMTMQAAGLPASQGLSIATQNPKYAYTSQIGAGNNIADLLNTLNSSIGQEFNLRAGTYKNTVDKQLTLLKSISDILNQNRETALTNKQIEAENARQANSLKADKDLKALELGLATLDDNGNISYISSSGTTKGGAVDLSGQQTKSDQAKTLRDAYSNAMSIGEKKRISDQAKQLGISLAPKDLSPKANDDLTNDLTLIGKIQNVLSVMDKYGDKFPTGLNADLRTTMSKIGAGELFGGQTDINQALADISAMRVNQEKLMGGIRAAGSPQMYQKMANATPGVERSAADNRSLLNDLLKASLYHIQLIAKQNQYADAQDMANNLGIEIPKISTSSPSQTKVVNGTTYQKGSDNLWHKQK